MKNRRILMSLGLSGPRADAYLTLLEQGGATATELAKKMGVQRTSVYAMLQSLAEEGFVETYIQKKRQFYRATKPERVAAHFEEKLDSFRSIIPLLQTLEKKEANSFGLRFIETISELERFYRDVLREYRNKEYRVIGSAPAWEGLDTDFFVQFRKDRAACSIHTRLLLTAESATINPTEPELLREFRYLPPSHAFKSTIDIFDDKILIVSPSVSALAIVVAVPAMTDIFASIFEMLWEYAGAPANSSA
ncbi:helix-turn-helix domain-containing protein [Candidatus Kaiserbacteria bacterium]|nr:helix-turn-helix domain-containing protein [Candidatus Kaiserbacteria bacterium]